MSNNVSTTVLKYESEEVKEKVLNFLTELEEELDIDWNYDLDKNTGKKTLLIKEKES